MEYLRQEGFYLHSLFETRSVHVRLLVDSLGLGLGQGLLRAYLLLLVTIIPSMSHVQLHVVSFSVWLEKTNSELLDVQGEQKQCLDSQNPT